MPKKILANVSNETQEKICDDCIDKEVLNKALINHNISFCIEIKDDAIKNVCEQILKG